MVLTTSQAIHPATGFTLFPRTFPQDRKEDAPSQTPSPSVPETHQSSHANPRTQLKALEGPQHGPLSPVECPLRGCCFFSIPSSLLRGTGEGCHPHPNRGGGSLQKDPRAKDRDGAQIRQALRPAGTN